MCRRYWPSKDNTWEASSSFSEELLREYHAGLRAAAEAEKEKRAEAQAVRVARAQLPSEASLIAQRAQDYRGSSGRPPSTREWWEAYESAQLEIWGRGKK